MTTLNKILLSFSVVLLALQPAFAEQHKDQKDPHKSLTDLSKPVMVDLASPEVSIRLSANPTTGYQWYLAKYNPDLIKPSRYQYVAAEGKMVGASGIDVWQFKLNQDAFVVPQLILVTFEYKRPFESSAEKTQEVQLITKPQSDKPE